MQRGDSHPRSPQPIVGGRQKVLLLPGDPLSPPASPTLLPGLESPRPGHRIPRVPALRLPGILHRGEKNPDSAPLRGPAWDRSSKVTRTRRKKSNHFASCRSHPRRSAAGRPPGSRCQAGSVPRAGPQEAPAQPDLAAALFPGTVTADRGPGRSPRGPASTIFLEKLPTHLAQPRGSSTYLGPSAPWPRALVSGAAERPVPQDAYVNSPARRCTRGPQRAGRICKTTSYRNHLRSAHHNDVSKWHAEPSSPSEGLINI